MKRVLALTTLKVVTVAVLMASASAQAALTPLTALETLQQFNAVVLGDLTSTNHIDGRTYVEGTLTGVQNAVFDMHPEHVVASNYAGLTVRGIVQAGQPVPAYAVSNAQVSANGAVVFGNSKDLGVNNGNSAVYGNTQNTSFNGTGSYYVSGTSNGGNLNVTKVLNVTPGTVQYTNTEAATSTDFKGVLGGLSNQLKSLTATSSVSVVGEQAYFSVVAHNGVAVFDLSDSLFDGSIKRFSFTGLDSATTVIFNTGVTSADFAIDFQDSAAVNYGSKMLWNFYGASDLTIHNQFGGSILATDATLTNYQNIEGGVYVSTLNHNGEIHGQNFTGSIPAVPEPATYAMLLAGLGLIGMTGRAARRRRQ